MAKTTKLPKKRYLDLYSKVMMIRKLEEKIDELFRAGVIYGPVHTSVGQEALAVGVAEALNEDDFVLATHRGHGHCLMRGADLNLMMAELRGKATGLCKGKGGSMHIVDVKHAGCHGNRRPGNAAGHRRGIGSQNAEEASDMRLFFRGQCIRRGPVSRVSQLLFSVEAPGSFRL